MLSLLGLLLWLLMLLVSLISSSRARIQYSADTSPSVASSRISLLVPSSTFKMSAAVPCRNIRPPGLRAPPLATVKLGTHVAAPAGSVG